MEIQTYGTKNISLRLINSLTKLFTQRKGFILVNRKVSLKGLDLSQEEM